MKDDFEYSHCLMTTGLIDHIHLAEEARIKTTFRGLRCLMSLCLVQVLSLLLVVADSRTSSPAETGQTADLMQREELQDDNHYSSLETQCSQKVYSWFCQVSKLASC
jgi:hypothetical protein